MGSVDIDKPILTLHSHANFTAFELSWNRHYYNTATAAIDNNLHTTPQSHQMMLNYHLQKKLIYSAIDKLSAAAAGIFLKNEVLIC